MAQLYVPGPCGIYVGANASYTPVYFGAAEHGVTIDFQIAYEGVKVDLGGSRIDFDKLYLGTAASVSAQIVRYNESVYFDIASIATPVNQDGSPGTDPFGAIGTLMIAEDCSYDLWITLPYASKQAFANQVAGAMPPCFHFWNAFLDKNSLPDLGTRPKKLHLTWECLREFTLTSTGSSLGVGEFVLFDYSTAGLPPIN